MGAIADIFELGFESYVKKYGSKIPLAHHKAVEAILACRTGKRGGHVYKCTNNNCKSEVFQPHSCNHRSCPSCQSRERYEWTLKQKSRLLPVPYFHLVFTIPASLRDLSREYLS